MELLNENLIALELSLPGREAVIERIADMLEESGRLSDRAAYIRDVRAREELDSTAFGFSLAMPHAKSAGVAAPSLVFIRLAEPVAWGEESVCCVFGIAVPQGNTNNEHLDILAMLARKTMDETFRESLINARGKDEVMKLLLS